jgi:hypothetical protein
MKLEETETTMPNQKLVPQQQDDALKKMLLACSTPSEIMLVKELNVTAINAKTELNQHLNREFLQEFSSQSPEAIRWAFHEWRAGSPYQPAISDIWKLLGRYYEKRRIDVATEEAEREKQETQRRLAAGERQIPYEEIRAMILGVVKKMDEVRISGERRSELTAQVAIASKKTKGRHGREKD